MDAGRSSSLDLEALRRGLVAFAVHKGTSRDDAEDLAGEALAAVLSRSAHSGSNFGEIQALAYRSLKNLIIDHYASPGRVLSKRLNAVLSRPTGPDPITAFTVGSITLISLASQRRLGIPALAPDTTLDSRLTEFLYGHGGLNGSDPQSLSTRALVERCLRWIGCPVPRDTLLSMLVLVGPRLPNTQVMVSDFDIPADLTASQASYEDAPDVETVRSMLLSLPFRMRASLLLVMDSELLEALFATEWQERLAIELAEWPPPPDLRTTKPPLSDEVIADRLGITKLNLQTTRSRARLGLRAKWSSPT